jgi:hypothetical protein
LWLLQGKGSFIDHIINTVAAAVKFFSIASRHQFSKNIRVAVPNFGGAASVF